MLAIAWIVGGQQGQFDFFDCRNGSRPDRKCTDVPCRVCSMPHCTVRQWHSRTRDPVRDPNEPPAENWETVDGIDALISSNEGSSRRMIVEIQLAQLRMVP
eukprot:scaffold40593_cov69-Cyclotella_meneghiniana.AAC.1